MRVLTVSQAKRGVKHVVANVLPRLADRGLDPAYLTVPTNEAPRGCERITLLDEDLLRTLEPYSLPYLLYGVLFFWMRAHHYLRDHADEYDVVWFHNPRLLPLTPGSVRDRLLVTFHNHLLWEKASHYGPVGGLYYRLFGTIERRGIAGLSDARFTVVYDEVATEVQRCGVPAGRVRYVGNGVDLDRFTPDRGEGVRDRLGLPDGPLLLSLGRIAPQKRPLALLRTFAEIRERRDDVTLAMAGDGPMRDRAERFVARRGIDGVRFLGFVDEDLKPDLYAGSDYFVLPSAYEGEPLVLYEALASGLPAIVADIPNLRFVDDADCGLVTDFDDPETAAEDVLSYLDSSRDHSVAAREYAEANLDWGSKTDAYVSELENVTRSRSSPNHG